MQNEGVPSQLKRPSKNTSLLSFCSFTRVEHLAGMTVFARYQHNDS